MPGSERTPSARGSAGATTTRAGSGAGAPRWRVPTWWSTPPLRRAGATLTRSGGTWTAASRGRPGRARCARRACVAYASTSWTCGCTPMPSTAALGRSCRPCGAAASQRRWREGRRCKSPCSWWMSSARRMPRAASATAWANAAAASSRRFPARARPSCESRRTFRRQSPSASPLLCRRGPAARRSRSASLTTGNACRATRWRSAARSRRWYWPCASGRTSRWRCPLSEGGHGLAASKTLIRDMCKLICACARAGARTHASLSP
mmetsp:Transcript_112222/g.349702  ORF Transcript_112222/g.349702 Transcript_112222/m.349702 type:complete len:264 (-) Transcript_112222:68-859(-)